MTKSIEIRDAHEHNLRHVNLSIPRDSIVVVTGVSGSGKSSLAFDTVFQEGQRRFVESLSAYARQFIGRMKHPEVESVRGISPTISIDQKTVNRNPRSTVGKRKAREKLMLKLWLCKRLPKTPKELTFM